MIKSMTGFASLTREDEAATISVTIRSVNHRFLDLQLRMPASLAPLETRLRALVQKRVARGRVELVRRACSSAAPPALDVELNEEFLDGARRRASSARAQQGYVVGRADARRSAALPAGADDPRAQRPRRTPTLARARAAGRGRGRRGARRARRDAGARRRLPARRSRRAAGAAWRPGRARRRGGRRGHGRRWRRGCTSACASCGPTRWPTRRSSRRRSRSSSAGRTSARKWCASAATSRTGRRWRDGAGAVRPQARFPAAGDEPRGQHDRARRPTAGGVGADRRAKAELEKMREQVQNVE